MFQTTNPESHAYTSNSLIVLHNNKCTAEMIEYIKTKYSYTIPQNSYKTLIINNNVFRFITHFNLFIISPEIFDDNPSVVLNIMTEYLSFLIRKVNKDATVCNIVDFKLYLYYGDGIEMPLCFVKENLYNQDILGNKINETIRLYIRNFRFTNEGVLTFHMPLNEDTFSRLIQNSKSTFTTFSQQTSSSSSSSSIIPQPVNSVTQPSTFVQPTSTPFTQPPASSTSFTQPPVSSPFNNPSSVPSATSFTQPPTSSSTSFSNPSSVSSATSFTQPSTAFSQTFTQPNTYTNSFKTPTSFSNPSTNANPFVKQGFPITFGAK